MGRGRPQAEHGAHTEDTQAFPSMSKIFSGHLKVMVRRQTDSVRRVRSSLTLKQDGI